MRSLSGLVAVLSALVLAPAAAAAPLTVPEPRERTCQDGLAAGAPGVATERFTAERAGIVTVTLQGADGDWDLALFAPDGRPDTASASMGSRETAVAYLRAGQALVAQACRRTGDDPRAELDFDLFAFQAPDPAERVAAAMVEVPLTEPGVSLRRLEATGVDVTHDVHGDAVKVVLYGAEDRAKLTAAGFTWRTLIPDMRAADLLRARADTAFAQRLQRSALPSGRTTYRTFADYGTDLKALVDGNPGLVRRSLIGNSLEGRPIEGVEIADGVQRTDDGRPVFAVMGLHHAREWPSGEMPMEFATDLVARFAAGDERVRGLLRRVRVLVLPMINPDGFLVSRSANGGVTTPADDDILLTIGQALTDQGAYKRKNCRPTAPGGENIPCAMRAPQGVDLNRNYGAFWGGIGSSGEQSSQGFRGAGPYSEPESEAVHRLSQTREIVTLITHHTFTRAGTWLRQPGFCMTNPADPETGDSNCKSPYPEDNRGGAVPPGPYDVSPDEAGQKALGDAMGNASGWLSQLGWRIGEITGATEDWNYYAAGAYGYTPEQRGGNFHPNFAQAVVAEYDGTAPTQSGRTPNGGVRESLLRAAEQAADPAQHSVIEGSAPAGRVLRLRKSFATATSREGLVVDDELDFRLTVPASGRYEWHVNPSTRPLSSPRSEAYTMTCETPQGAVLETRRVVVDRGERVTADFTCVQGAQAGAPAPGGLPGTQGLPRLERFTAKLQVARARVLREDRILDVLAPITRRASGLVRVEFRAAGRTERFTTRVDSENGRLRFRRRIPASQARLGTGILTLRYAGDADTRPQVVRLRAASQRAALDLERPTIANNRIRAAGTVSRRARGIVRLQIQYDFAGATRTLALRGRIRDGRWRIDAPLSAAVRDALLRRTGTVHSYTLFTGFFPRRVRGEMRSFQVLGAP